MKIFTDWLYWFNSSKVQNMLVYNPNNFIMDCTFALKIDFFKDSTTIKSETYDLIYIPFNLNNINIKNEEFYRTCISHLSKNGKLVIVKQINSIFLNKLYLRIFANSTFQLAQDFKGNSKSEVRKIKKKHKLKIEKELFVFPSIIKAWTISDSPKFIKNFKIVKKKTKRNKLIFNLLTSNLFVWLANYFWHNRILIISRND